VSSFEAGTLAGAGSLECEGCGFAVALHEGDEVPDCPSCGGSSFRRASLFSTSASAPAPRGEGSEPRWLIAARAGLVHPGDYLAFELDGDVRVVPLEDGWTRVGRSLSAHLRLDDPTVSRRHALVYRDDHEAKVLDDRSLNGVFRNGERVELAHLGDGDAISIGRFTLHFLQAAGDRAPARL